MQNKDKNTTAQHEITMEDFQQFSQATSYQERINILMAHAQKNKKRIEIRRKRQMEKTTQQIEQEMVELNQQFSDFLHTKGIGAKFKLAFNNMKQSARAQHQADVEQFNAIKAKSAEQNKDFVEFLHAKGFKAKLHLVIENIKRGARESRQKTAEQIAKVRAQTQANIANAGAHKAPVVNQTYTAESLAEEFNAFLKSKGLDSQYTVVVTDEE